MANIYEGWEASALFANEVTAGLPVTPTDTLGVVKSVSARGSAQIEQEGGLGTPYPVSLEEGMTEAGGSFEFLPAGTDVLELAKRDGSGFLSSFTLFSGAGPGVNHTGCKANNLRLTIEPGGRLRGTFDWFALAPVDQAFITPVIPTDELMNWIKLVHNYSDEVASIEISIAHNLSRRGALANASAPWPVSGQKRPPVKIKEGRQSVTATVKWFERPSDNMIANIIAELDSSLVFTGLVGGSPISFTISLIDGKMDTREFSASENAEAGWPSTFIYKNWGVA